MDLTVTAMVLLTALLHAGWNAVYNNSMTHARISLS